VEILHKNAHLMYFTDGTCSVQDWKVSSFFTLYYIYYSHVQCGMCRWPKMVLWILTTCSKKWLQFPTQENESTPDCKEGNTRHIMDGFWGYIILMMKFFDKVVHSFCSADMYIYIITIRPVFIILVYNFQFWWPYFSALLSL